MVKRLLKNRMSIVIFCIVVILSMGMIFGCSSEISNKKVKNLTLWYTQEELKPYLEAATKTYKKETGIEVLCEYRPSVQYLDEIYELSLAEDNKTPDLYLLRHDKLGQACMMGIASTNVSEAYSKDNYCETALESASWNGKQMGYPFYYNTACMLYNADYFKETPATMGAITAFSETAEIGENVTSIFAWDINDYFYNYSFVGEYLDFDEENGILKNEATQGLQQFQALGQYFAIDDETITKELILKDFCQGRTLCILADSHMIGDIANGAVMESATMEGVQVPYTIGPIPDIGEELKSCAGSYTELAVVNGMSYKQEAAADFAEFLTDEYASYLYAKSSQFSAKAGIQYDKKELSEMYKIYAQSKQFPNLLETEDLGASLETLFANVWDGSDVAEELRIFTDKIELRMNK